MNVQSFSSLMAAMLKELQIHAPLKMQGDSITVHFEGHPDMHFINRVPPYLDIVSDASTLGATVSNDKLFSLLALNSLDPQNLSCAVTVHRASGTVVVLCRQPMAQLDLPMLLQMKQAVHAKVAEVQRIVSQADPPIQLPRTASSAWMKNRVLANSVAKP